LGAALAILDELEHYRTVARAVLNKQQAKTCLRLLVEL